MRGRRGRIEEIEEIGRVHTPSVVGSSKGKYPARRTKRTVPRLQMSAILPLYPTLLTTSGATVRRRDHMGIEV